MARALLVATTRFARQLLAKAVDADLAAVPYTRAPAPSGAGTAWSAQAVRAGTYAESQARLSA